MQLNVYYLEMKIIICRKPLHKKGRTPKLPPIPLGIGCPHHRSKGLPEGDWLTTQRRELMKRRFWVAEVKHSSPWPMLR